MTTARSLEPRLAEGVADADLQAEAAVCRRYSAAVRTYARRRLRGREAVEELVQDVLLIVVQALREGRVTQVDLELEAPAGGVKTLVRDLRPDPEDGALYLVCERELAKVFYATGAVRGRTIAVRDGRRETLASYVGTCTVE